MTDSDSYSERALLHRGGARAQWGNLGLWRRKSDYASACAALARAVGEAAGITPGDAVLSVACGAGEELLLWADAFQAHNVVGTEIDARVAAQARRRIALHPAAPAIRVLTQPAPGWHVARSSLTRLAPFDVVLCVDAAYHLSPRSRFLHAAFGLLRPGGRLAFTDLVLEPGATGTRGARLVRNAARLCGVPHEDLTSLRLQHQRLAAAGFTGVRTRKLDDGVLGGFTRFVQRQELTLGRDAWRRGWLRPALTASLIPAGRAAGLGYALLSALKPEVASGP